MQVAICDDEVIHLTIYKKTLQTIAEKHNLPIEIITYGSGDEMLFKLGETRVYPDVLFLDIGMPGIMGVDAAKRLRELNVPAEIIFLTAHKQYALEAFDVDAMHYIVKGEVDEEKFENIFLKAVERAEKKTQEVITVSCAGESRIIPVAEIKYFEVKNYIITVYYGDEEFEFYSTLGKIENALVGRGFLRTHRAFLVNERVIKRITRKEVELTNGTELPVGRSYWSSLQEILEKKSTL